MDFKKIASWFRSKESPFKFIPLIKKEFYDGSRWWNFATEYYGDNKHLSDFQLPLTDISINNYGLTNVKTPVNPQDVAIKSYVDARIPSGPGITSITGFVEGVNPTSGILTTTRGATCLLTNIPAGGDVDMGGFRVKNIQQSPSDGFDATSLTFLMDLMNDSVMIQWP